MAFPCLQAHLRGGEAGQGRGRSIAAEDRRAGDGVSEEPHPEVSVLSPPLSKRLFSCSLNHCFRFAWSSAFHPITLGSRSPSVLSPIAPSPSAASTQETRLSHGDLRKWWVVVAHRLRASPQ